MKKELKQRAEAYADTTGYPFMVYFSQTVPDTRYRNKKYFFKYLNTHTVAESFATQKELDEFLKKKGF